jgi:excisionase family DNA binding protein
MHAAPGPTGRRESNWMTPKQAADYLGVGIDTIHDAYAAGGLKRDAADAGSGTEWETALHSIAVGARRDTPAPERQRPGRHRRRIQTAGDLPALLSVDEIAVLLRTTRKAVYAMLERDQLPRPFHIGRRLLLRQDELLDWLNQKRAPSLKE